MRKKRFWRQAAAVVLSAAMVLGSGLPAVKAEDSMEVELNGSAEENGVYLTIGSARDLLQFARNVNNGNSYYGKIIKLTADIAFDGTTVNNFPGIGYNRYGFEGTFDGDGHSISGIDMTDVGSAGLFRYNRGFIKNVTVKDSEFSGASAGGIVVSNSGVIVNCHNRGANVKSTIDKCDYVVGGIAGYSCGVIRNCSSDGTVTASYYGVYAGGIVGAQEDSGGIYNSCNWGSVTGGSYYTGGIVGYADDANTIQNCYNTGTVTGGGIAGKVESTIVADCYCSEESADYNFITMNGTEKRNESFSADYMKTAEFAAKLNANRGSNSNWLEWELRADAQYPQLKALTDLSGCTVTLSADRFGYTGEEIKPGVTVSLGGKTLIEGEDYSVVYQDNIKKGTGKVIVLGEGIYKGSVVRTFVIEKQKHAISCATYYKKAYGDYGFNLNASLKVGDGSLSYSSSNKQVASVSSYGYVTLNGTGRAVIRVTAAATDAYDTATVNVTVDVCPKKQALTVKSVKSKKIKIAWTKDGKASGYQVQYGTSKSLSKTGKTKLISKKSRSSLTLKKLKKKKTYYIRVRSFRKVQTGGKTLTLYGAWSKISKVKTAKK